MPVSPEVSTASGAWGNMIFASVDVEGVLLLLKASFLVLLYLFIWRIVRTASRDLRLPQESFVLGPQQAAAVGLRPELRFRFIQENAAKLDEAEVDV